MVSEKLNFKNSNPSLWNIYPSWNPHMVAIPRVVLHFGWIISAPYTKVTIVEPWTKSKNKNRPTANNAILYCATIAVPIENTAEANMPNTNVFFRPKRSEIWNDYNDWQKNWGWFFYLTKSHCTDKETSQAQWVNIGQFAKNTLTIFAITYDIIFGY